MGKILLIIIAVALTGCAQTRWSHPTKSEAEFRVDSAYCQNEAMRNVQEQVAAPVTPIYTVPTQYDTSCSRIGAFTNCSTTAQPNYAAQLAQQNAQNMAQAGASIGTGIARGQYTESCLMTLGYRKEVLDRNVQVDQVTNADKYRKAMKELNDEFQATVCLRPSFRSIFQKTPCNRTISLAQFSDTSTIDPSDKEAFNEYTNISNSFLDREVEITEKYMTQPLSGALVLFLRKSQDSARRERSTPLYSGEISWGEYNKRRSEQRIQNMQERSEIINKTR